MDFESRQLTVCSCINSMSEVGGTERHAVRLCESLVAAGIRTRCFTLNATGAMRERYIAASVPVDTIAISSLASLDLIRAANRLGRLSRESGVTVLHAHDSYSNLVAAIAGRLYQIPVITSKRWTDYRWRQHRWTDLAAYGLSHHIVVNSEAVRRSLPRIMRDRSTVVSNSVDTDVFCAIESRESVRERLGIADETLLVGMVAMMRPEKRHEMMLRGFRRVLDNRSNAKLLLVGDGPQRAHIQTLVQTLHLEGAVLFAGAVDDAWRYLGACDIAVLTSAHEGSPNAVVEAMAMGLPVVATAVGGIPDLVAEGRTGFLVRAEDDERLAARLIELLDSKSIRNTFGQAAQAVAIERFSISASVSAHLSLYTDLLERMPQRSNRSTSRPDRPSSLD